MAARHLALALAALLAAAGPAMAQTDVTTATIQAELRGSVLSGCLLETPQSTGVSNAQVSELSPGSANIAINQMVGEDGAVIGAIITLVLPATCNQAHTLNLSSLRGGLLGDGPASSSGAFRSEVPYTVTVSWAGASQTFQTQDGDLSLALGEAVTGPVTITINIPAGGLPLVAGAYSDELTLVLGAAG
ncbi:MAG: hypothetical protein GC145_02630 [Caulobacter sp.]|nr:hypothetical protein [Caulobacter sp.]